MSEKTECQFGANRHSLSDCKGTLPIIGVTKVNQVEEAAAATQIVLTSEEITRLEKLGDETGVHTLRDWEKEMIEA